MKKRRPSKRAVKIKERKLKEALAKEPKQFEKTESFVEKKEKRLWKLFRPMKELGEKRYKKRKLKHIKHKHY